MAGLTDLITLQPFKGLYVFFALMLNLSKLPFWLLYYLPEALRQHPSFTYEQAVKNEVTRNFLYNCSAIRVRTLLNLRPGGGVSPSHFKVMPPSTKPIYRGVLDDAEIKPGTTSGVWYGASPYSPAIESEQPVVLHFHGGAFVIGEARDRNSAFLGKTFARHIAKTLMVDYRLSSNAGGRFPAALQDAVTAYQSLLDAGIFAYRIIISGDSAGGNLAIALLRYIEQSDRLLPAPAGMMLWSPWVDLTAARDPGAVARNPRYSSDYLVGNFTAWGAATYAPPDRPIALGSEWVSPLWHPFAAPKTAVFVQTGGAEVLLDDNVKFAEDMRGVAGNRVELHIEHGATHDIMMVGGANGFAREAENAAKVAGKWVRGLMQ